MGRATVNIKVVIVAAVTAMVTGSGSWAVAAVYDAVNADKVDGKHAVGARATGLERSGKLVATNPRTGRLPNNIIAKAPNANLLDGRDSRAFVRRRHVHHAMVMADGQAVFKSSKAVKVVHTATGIYSVTLPPENCVLSLTLVGDAFGFIRARYPDEFADTTGTAFEVHVAGVDGQPDDADFDLLAFCPPAPTTFTATQLR